MKRIKQYLYVIQKIVLLFLFCIIVYRMMLFLRDDVLPTSEIKMITKYCDKYNIELDTTEFRLFNVIYDDVFDEINHTDTTESDNLFKGYKCIFYRSNPKTIHLSNKDFVYFPNNDLKWESMCYYTQGTNIIYPKPNSLYINQTDTKVSLKYNGNKKIPIIVGIKKVK